MRIVIQRVASAAVTVKEDVVGRIESGLLCLVGIERTDRPDDLEWCTTKIVNARLFDNESTGKPWALSVKSAKKQILLVSQFTLHGFFSGSKPDFHYASTSTCLASVG